MNAVNQTSRTVPKAGDSLRQLAVIVDGSPSDELRDYGAHIRRAARILDTVDKALTRATLFGGSIELRLRFIEEAMSEAGISADSLQWRAWKETKRALLEREYTSAISQQSCLCGPHSRP